MNQKLVEDLHKPIIKKFGKRKVYSSFKDNIWGSDLADMQITGKYNKEQVISKHNKRFWFSLCVIGNFSIYVWVISLKEKIGMTITIALQTMLDESEHKPDKIWVEKGSKF